VSEVESLPMSTMEQTVRQGRGQMPMWDTQQLSDSWLSYIVSYLQAVHQGTPVPTVTRNGITKTSFPVSARIMVQTNRQPARRQCEALRGRVAQLLRNCSE